MHSSDLIGTGAALYPGRWNKLGTPVLYTGESVEIALLETVVNTPPMVVPNLDLLEIKIPEDSIFELKPKDLPSNWKDYPAPSILAEIGQEWVNVSNAIALKVPSCVSPTAHNFILNCAHPDYRKKVRLIGLKPFEFDPRLTRK
ncbi:MAG: RES domain-containing protein [Granulosicoccus sp.]|jgi:RES domain-containing protein